MNEDFINIKLHEIAAETNFQDAMDALLASIEEILLEKWLNEMENVYSAHSYCEE